MVSVAPQSNIQEEEIFGLQSKPSPLKKLGLTCGVCCILWGNFEIHKRKNKKKLTK